MNPHEGWEAIVRIRSSTEDSAGQPDPQGRAQVDRVKSEGREREDTYPILTLDQKHTHLITKKRILSHESIRGSSCFSFSILFFPLQRPIHPQPRPPFFQRGQIWDVDQVDDVLGAEFHALDGAALRRGKRHEVPGPNAFGIPGFQLLPEGAIERSNLLDDAFHKFGFEFSYSTSGPDFSYGWSQILQGF